MSTKYLVFLSVLVVFCLFLISSVSKTNTYNTDKQKTTLLSITKKPPLKVTTPTTTLTSTTEITTPTPAPIAPETATTRPSLDTEKPVVPYYYEVDALVTAYCPCRRCCGKYADGVTATNTSAWGKGVAAAPRKFSYGTRVYIEGYGSSIIDDTGIAMRRSLKRGIIHFDVRMTYHWEARQWGSRQMKVRIYK